ncbi:phage tail protein [Escherichia coli]|nr:phage tail protein [Escherichia coli]MCZ6439164.1 phage tail protein [Escherichia coli]
MMPVSCYLCIFINVGLGEGSALPVGVPVPWPSATPPTGWLKCNGAAFSAEEYPELAKAYPTNKLPDLRGEFIRGWDDERGIDLGRTLLSVQDATIEAHEHYYNGAIYTSSGPSWANATGAGHLAYSGFTSSYGGGETRPRNIAFNFIVRAA